MSPVEALQGVFLRDEDIEAHEGPYSSPMAAIRALGYGDAVKDYNGNLTPSIEGLLAISLYEWRMRRNQLGIWHRCRYQMELTGVVLFDWGPAAERQFAEEAALELAWEISWLIFAQGCKECGGNR